MSIEVALSKLRSAQICHPNAVQFLIDEAITAIQQAGAKTDELLHPEDFNVEVVIKPVGGFAPVSTQGVRVTHKPTGISVTCDAARSQHTNRHHAFEQLRAILSLRPQAVPMTDEQAVLEDEEFSLLSQTQVAALLWVLWCHQGASSPVGQPIRFALGMDKRQAMSDEQVSAAQRFRIDWHQWSGITAQAKKEGV